MPLGTLTPLGVPILVTDKPLGLTNEDKNHRNKTCGMLYKSSSL